MRWISFIVNLSIFLNKCSTNEETRLLLLTGESVPSCIAKYIKKDELWCSLTAKSKYDDTVSTILKTLTKSWYDLLRRLLVDHITGGKFHSMSDEDKIATSSVVKHNKIAEELFGQLDRLMHVRPRATVLTNESHIMYNKNRTSDWLSEKNEEERHLLIESSRSRAQQLYQNYANLKTDIKESRLASLKEKQKKREEAKKKSFKQKEKLTNDMLYYGLWQSKDEVSDHMSCISSKTEKLKAIKTQINFRKIVLEQPVKDKKIFSFSSKEEGVFSLERLLSNLHALLTSAKAMEVSSANDILSGCEVLHNFKEGDKCTVYQGRVIGHVASFPEWYNIVYRDDPCVVYTYKLMEDFKAGDLKII